jgi:hypothetical protein
LGDCIRCIMYTKTNRYSKAMVIAVTSRIIKGDGFWYVESQTTQGKYYKTTLGSCECSDFINRQETCKHILALIEYVGARFNN